MDTYELVSDEKLIDLYNKYQEEMLEFDNPKKVSKGFKIFGAGIGYGILGALVGIVATATAVLIKGANFESMLHLYQTVLQSSPAWIAAAAGFVAGGTIASAATYNAINKEEEQIRNDVENDLKSVEAEMDARGIDPQAVITDKVREEIIESNARNKHLEKRAQVPQTSPHEPLVEQPHEQPVVEQPLNERTDEEERTA